MILINSRKKSRWMSAGAAVLGVALCAPAGMLAQTSTPPPNSSEGAPQTSAQVNPRSGRAMHRHRRHRGHMSPARQLAFLTKKLNLTADQQQKMLPVLQDQHSRFQAIRKNSSLSREQRRDQARQVFKDTRQKLEALMTAGQKEKFSQAMKRHRGRFTPTRQLAALTKKLSLTSDQQQKMLPVLQDAQNQMKSVMKNQSLTREQRRTQGRQIMQSSKQKLEALMTPSQQEKFQQLLQHHRQHWQGHNPMGAQEAPAPQQ